MFVKMFHSFLMIDSPCLSQTEEICAPSSLSALCLGMYTESRTLPWPWHSWRRCSLEPCSCSCTRTSVCAQSGHDNLSRCLPRVLLPQRKSIDKSPNVSVWTERLLTSQLVSEAAVTFSKHDDVCARGTRSERCECRPQHGTKQLGQMWAFTQSQSWKRKSSNWMRLLKCSLKF